MLLEELMETGICIELVKTLDEVVKVHVLPAINEFVAIAYDFHFPLFYFQVNCHVCHPLVADALLIAEVFVVDYSRMFKIRGKPCINVFRILSCQVFAKLLKSRCARKDAHQFDGFRHLWFDLCVCSQCQYCEQRGDDGFLIHYSIQLQ